MGSSKGGAGNPNQPSGMPVGPAGGAPPPGIAPPYNPAFMSFLPPEAGAVATGLTQPMINQINRPPPPPPAMMPQMSIPRDQLAQLMAMLNRPRPTRQFGDYTLANGLMGYNYRGGANRSGGGGPGGGYGSSGGGGYSTSGRGGGSSSAHGGRGQL
jgi:hypothetical protein